ncbi:MAG: ComF family protein [Phycisphaerales bacterium]|nr:ComF family protein [Phycisphaerales bacterium]MCB9835434.1 ComF family protein [Phycisphaera sp.]
MPKHDFQDETSQDTLPFVWPPVRPEGDAVGFIEPKPGSIQRRQMPRPMGHGRKPTWIEDVESALLGTRSRVLTGTDGRWSPEPIDFACPRCGRDVGEGEVAPDDGKCSTCRAERYPWERLIRLGRFEGELRDAILATKYEAWRRQGTLLGRLMGERLTPMLAEADIEPIRALLVPVPMPMLRRMTRGIDHSLVLTRGVRDVSGVPIDRILSRRGGKPQVRIAPSLRARNVQNRIRAGFRPRSQPDLVVLVDDVKTTGATLRACGKAIRVTEWGRQVPIWSVVAAVTGERSRPGRSEFDLPA